VPFTRAVATERPSGFLLAPSAYVNYVRDFHEMRGLLSPLNAIPGREAKSWRLDKGSLWMGWTRSAARLRVRKRCLRHRLDNLKVDADDAATDGPRP